VPNARRAAGAELGRRFLAVADGVPALGTWLRLIVWLAIGLVLYFAYGRSHAVLMNSTR
jgi:APA family basic amino acid/polyamine antiporter